MRARLPLSEAPESICILRISALGDVTHVLPVVNAIRRQWPQARLSWIIGVRERRLLRHVSGIEFIEFDKRGGLDAVRQLRRQLKARRFDVLLHMQVAARANLLSCMVPAAVKLGWDRARSRDLHHWFTHHSVPAAPFQHQVEGFLSFAHRLGAAPAEPEWHLPVAAEDRSWVAQFVDDQLPLLVISPCSSHPLRNWCAEGYARVADHAAAGLGMQVVLSGGPGQANARMADSIQAMMQTHAINLVGKDTLPQLIALLDRADVVLSPDSGPAHIASALGTPVIGLYAATWSRRSGPYRSLDLCVDRFREAARLFRKREPEALRWGTRIEVPGVMDLIRAEDVIEQLDTLPGRGQRNAS
jgi:heptosyltransferase I